ncbi:YceI family protein [Pontiella agarivorans]|uniref:YceI family protein n=1 Tax=Pontiella agarivorans TaxID=3038953 RepID=A0ABU5MZX0_9BACT|nr:YceI family protein [Pontiella agarivorans]MDZ8119719.1 YceI family protein [Pontiella agarivorans]
MPRIVYPLYLSFLLALSPRADTAAETTAFVTFKGTSTLHDFEGTATSQPFALTFTEIPEIGQIRLSATADLNVSTMDTANKKRDRKMFTMLDREHFQLISGSLPETVIPVSGSGHARLKLKIRDTEQYVEATLSNWQREGNTIRVDLTFPVSLAAFGLKPPSVLGMIRVGDTVNVTCEIEGNCQ